MGMHGRVAGARLRKAEIHGTMETRKMEAETLIIDSTRTQNTWAPAEEARGTLVGRGLALQNTRR